MPASGSFHDPSGGSRLDRPQGRRVAATVAVAVAVATGLALRVAMLVADAGTLDGDEAVVGLMAIHTLDGDVPVFFWGQGYGGAHESYLAAVFFAMAGPSVLALKLVPLMLSGVSALLVWRVGRRAMGEVAGAVAGLAFWVWPATYLWWSTKERGFYWIVMALGLAVLLLALRLRDDPERRRDWALLGLAVGTGWWASPQIVFFAIPAGLWLLATLRGRVVRHLPIAAVTAAAGAVPWVAFNLRNDWAAFDAPPATVEESYFGHFETLAERAFPMSLGLRKPYLEGWVHDVIGPVLAVAFVATLVYVAVRRWRGATLFVLGVALFPFLYAVSPVASYVGEGRYAIFLWPFVALLLGRAVSDRAWLGAGLVAALAMLSLWGLRAVDAGGSPYTEGVRVPDSTEALRDVLEDHDVTRVFASYWVAYRVTFESEEEIVAAAWDFSRHQPYQDLVRAAPRPAWVFPVGSNWEPVFRHTLAVRGIPAERLAAGDFVLYLPAARVLPEDIVVPAPS